MTNKPEILGYISDRALDVLRRKIRPQANISTRGNEKVRHAVISLSDHEADRAASHAADKALIAELGEELAYALADFDAWASHEDNHPHDHLAAWSERARAALAKTRGDA